MMVIESYVVNEGMRVRVRALCNGQCHLGNYCEGRAVNHLVPTAEIEDYGFSESLQSAVRRILADYPGLLELIDH